MQFPCYWETPDFESPPYSRCREARCVVQVGRQNPEKSFESPAKRSWEPDIDAQKDWGLCIADACWWAREVCLLAVAAVLGSVRRHLHEVCRRLRSIRGPDWHIRASRGVLPVSEDRICSNLIGIRLIFWKEGRVNTVYGAERTILFA